MIRITMFPLFLHLLLGGGFLASGQLEKESSSLRYYVTPGPSRDCPPNTVCSTLDEYANNASKLFTNQTNVELLFLSGVHNLTLQTLLIQGVGYFEMAGVLSNSTSQGVVLNVVCPECSLSFFNITNLCLEHIVINFFHDDSIALFGKIQACTQNNLSFNTVPLIFFDVHELLLFDSLFSDCSLSIYINCPITEGFSKQQGSNLAQANIHLEMCSMIRTEVEVDANTTDLSISILNANFTDGDGLEAYIHNSSNVFTNISSSMFSNNQNGLSFVLVTSNYLHMFIEDTDFLGNSQTGVVVGAGDNNSLDIVMNSSSVLSSKNGIQILSVYGTQASLQLDVRNSTVSHMQGTGIDISVNSSVVIAIQQSQISYCDSNGLSIDCLGSQELMIHESSIVQNFENGIQAVYKPYSERNQITLYLMISCSNISWNHQTGVHVSPLQLEGSTYGAFSVVVSDTYIIKNEGGGVHLESSVHMTMSLQNTHFLQNEFEGLYVHLNPPMDTTFHIVIENCTIKNTLGLSLGANGGSKYGDAQNSSLILRNVSFLYNRDTTSTRLVTTQVAGAVEVLVESCEFEGNYLTPIQMILGSLQILDDAKFVNNYGLKGGALSLDYSRLKLANNTVVWFENNTALDVGGAIYVESSRKLTLCFYQTPFLSPNSIINISLFFTNNSAYRGGNDIYGAPLRDDCFVSSSQVISSSSIYKTVFISSHVHNSDLSNAISSNPQRVCLCDSIGRPMCSDIQYIFMSKTLFPGEQFNVSAVVVGYEFGTLSSEVYATYFPEYAEPSLNLPIQSAQKGVCNTRTYSVPSMKSGVLVLTGTAANLDFHVDVSQVQSAAFAYTQDNKTAIPDVLLSTPIFINVTVIKCPLGFQVRNDLIECGCNDLLQRNGINTCSVANRSGLITRSGTQWVGHEQNNIIVGKYCPFSYCKSKALQIDVSNSMDSQCLKGRSGMLCGHCKTNFSLILGSTQCWDCSDDRYLLLLVAFAAAGILLVLIIKYLDLTVTLGMVNGLIFYANIVWTYQNILFPPESDHLTITFNMFIAWLNLDVGINMCLFNGLTAYWKTWLQFVFPLYIWLIAGLIIVISRYSFRATKIFGNNSISVLATLFLLSYTKLLRTVVKALQVTYLETAEGYKTVWTEDGNIDYFSFEHIILLSVSLLILTFFWMPFMMSLLFIQPLKRFSHLKLFKWVDKWKPFFDAFLGPLKDRFHFWVGLLLVARGFLLVINVIVTPLAPEANLLAVAIVTAVLGWFPYVYKNWYLSFIENSFFFNLTGLFSGLLYASLVGSSKAKYILVSISLGIAFIEFILIVVFHICRSLHHCIKRNRRQTRTELSRQPVNYYQSTYDSETRPTPPYQVPSSQVVSNEYREPLLSSSASQ